MAFTADKVRQGVQQASTGVYEIDNSLRFNDDDSAYLSRTPTTAGNRKTWTWSGWVKLGNLGINRVLFSADTISNYLRIFSDNTIGFGISGVANFQSTAVLRDPSAWYHIVWKVDTTLASARSVIYVNNEVFYSTDGWTQNADTRFNNTVVHSFGRDTESNNNYLDGYLAEVNFVDGQALTPADFGEFDATYGHWKPKAYTGTYGTNGFYLDFKLSAATSSGLGNDASSNSNNWTPTNLASTDQMLDSPTNNFATLNSAEYNSGISNDLYEGNLRARGRTSSYSGAATGTINQSSGKWYWEVYLETLVNSGSNNYPYIGCYTDNEADSPPAKHSAFPLQAWSYSGWAYERDGIINLSGTGTKHTSSLTALANGDILGIGVDLENGEVRFWLNGAALYSGNAVISGLTGMPHLPVVGNYNGSAEIFNFGQDSSFAGNKTSQGNTDSNSIGDFYYTPPSGYLALCTQNLPEPTVVPSENFETVLWTGDSTTTRVIDTNIASDFTWIKCRNNAMYHLIWDTVRGAGTSSNYKDLVTSETGIEGNRGGYGYLSNFDSDTTPGFTLSKGDGAGNAIYGWHNTNVDTKTYVAWNWKAGGTPTVDNSASAGAVPTANSVMIDGASSTAALAGSIAATRLSANRDAGFSIVQFAGGAGTIAHGLDYAPEMVIEKKKDATGDWFIQYTVVDGTSDYMRFTTAAGTTSSSSLPTTTVFDSNIGGNNVIAYCFHSVDGYSKVGSYTGNGSTDGTFVHTGFKPAYVMIKATTSGTTGRWVIMDSARDDINPNTIDLWAERTDGETNAPDYSIDFTSNGFKQRNNNGSSVTHTNKSNINYIYIAFAEHPFKYSTAR